MTSGSAYQPRRPRTHTAAKEFAVSTTRLSDDILALAENVGAHAEPDEQPKAETKVVTRSSKKVRTK